MVKKHQSQTLPLATINVFWGINFKLFHKNSQDINFITRFPHTQGNSGNFQII